MFIKGQGTYSEQNLDEDNFPKHRYVLREKKYANFTLKFATLTQEKWRLELKSERARDKERERDKVREK